MRLGILPSNFRQKMSFLLMGYVFLMCSLMYSDVMFPGGKGIKNENLPVSLIMTITDIAPMEENKIHVKGFVYLENISSSKISVFPEAILVNLRYESNDNTIFTSPSFLGKRGSVREGKSEPVVLYPEEFIGRKFEVTAVNFKGLKDILINCSYQHEQLSCFTPNFELMTHLNKKTP